MVAHLLNGFQIKGYVKGFDSFVIMMEVAGKEQMVYKHAISTITRLRVPPLKVEAEA